MHVQGIREKRVVDMVISVPATRVLITAVTQFIKTYDDAWKASGVKPQELTIAESLLESMTDSVTDFSADLG